MRSSTPWAEPPDSMTYGSNDVHVWLADLDQIGEHNPELSLVLNAAERKRAQRFVREHDSERFVAARGTLRSLLGRYLGLPPERISFTLGPYGKPELDLEVHQEALQFNISHAGSWALFAFSYGRELGVDIECERPMPDLETIAEHFFSPHEVLALRSVPPPARQAAFFRCWCRKEAFIKATGRGLYMSLAGFDVSLKPGEPAALLAVADAPEEVKRWSMHELPAVEGCVAALVVEGHDWVLSCWYLASAKCS